MSVAAKRSLLFYYLPIQNIFLKICNGDMLIVNDMYNCIYNCIYDYRTIYFNIL